MPNFRVAWQTLVDLVTSETLLTGTQPSIEDEGGNGSRNWSRRRVSPSMLAALRAQATRRVPRYFAPAKQPTVVQTVAVQDEPDEAEEIAALRMLNLL